MAGQQAGRADRLACKNVGTERQHDPKAAQQAGDHPEPAEDHPIYLRKPKLHSRLRNKGISGRVPEPMARCTRHLSRPNGDRGPARRTG